jgi:hypothetical protein
MIADANMSDEQLTSELAVRAMRWRLAPGRFLKGDRGWTSRSGFRPLVDANDAFRVLDAIADEYSMLAKPGGQFSVRVRAAGGRTGEAMGESKTRTICLAVAHALGIDLGEKS